MSLAELRRAVRSEGSPWVMCRYAHERNMRVAQLQRDACISQLQSGTTTSSTDDGGVMVTIHASTIGELRERAALREREAQAAEREQRAWRGCVVSAWRIYSHRCRVVARLKAAALDHSELQPEQVNELQVQLRAAHEFAARESQRFRPLVVCRASNAPNVLSVTTELRNAAVQAKDAAT